MISHTVGYVGFSSYKDRPTICPKPGKPHCIGYISEVCKRDICRSIGNFNRYSTSNAEDFKGALITEKEKIGGDRVNYEYQHEPRLLKYAAYSKNYNEAIKHRKHNLLEDQITQPQLPAYIEPHNSNSLYKSTQYWSSIYEAQSANVKQ
jgi:hypothetical protein